MNTTCPNCGSANVHIKPIATRTCGGIGAVTCSLAAAKAGTCGAAIGTALCPGVGTLLGGLSGIVYDLIRLLKIKQIALRKYTVAPRRKRQIVFRIKTMIKQAHSVPLSSVRALITQHVKKFFRHICLLVQIGICRSYSSCLVIHIGLYARQEHP